MFDYYEKYLLKKEECLATSDTYIVALYINILSTLYNKCSIENVYT